MIYLDLRRSTIVKVHWSEVISIHDYLNPIEPLEKMPSTHWGDRIKKKRNDNSMQTNNHSTVLPVQLRRQKGYFGNWMKFDDFSEF